MNKLNLADLLGTSIARPSAVSGVGSMLNNDLANTQIQHQEILAHHLKEEQLK